MRGNAHIFLPPRDDDAGFATFESLRRQLYRLESAAANLIDRGGGRFHGQTGVERRLPGRILPLTGRQHLPQNHLIDLPGLEPGSFQQRADDPGA